MKLVQEKYGDERKFIVSDSLVKRGFDFTNNQDILTDADEEIYKEYLKRNNNKLISEHYSNFLENKRISYSYIPEFYISIEEIKALISKWKYFLDDENNEYMESSKILEYEECNFLEWWNGHENKQKELIDDITDLECISTQLEEKEKNKALFGQYDLYKDQENNYYLYWNSYYQGNLGSVEDITLEGIEERFDFDISNLK
jgi:hypothetical protein